MNKGRKLTIALDWDNVLAPCTELACQKMTQRGTPVDVSEVTLYSFANFPKELQMASWPSSKSLISTTARPVSWCR